MAPFSRVLDWWRRQRRVPADPPADPTKQTNTWRRRLPRPETILLLLALAWTAGAKFLVVYRHRPPSLAVIYGSVVIADLAFFAVLALGIALLYAYHPRRWAARGVLLLATATLCWAVVNAAWLIATGVQLQPGILWVLLQDPQEFWPIVQTHLARKLTYAVPLGLTLALCAGWLVYRFVRPVALAADRRRHVHRAIASGIVLAATLGGGALIGPGAQLSSVAEVMNFSSHWYALAATVTGGSRFADIEAQSRELPRAGQRQVTPPQLGDGQWPNVLVLFLESTRYSSTSLANAELQATTPNLARVASEGVEFSSTRVPVAQTSKAFWAALTGTTPDLDSDYIEAVLADEPYEGLPSILGRCGYRSAFFEVSKGTFECAPGLFSNLAFDWAWFRENLEDPSAHVGYLSGDDFRMIEPAFEWVEADAAPFLLVMITSVAHDPYEVPAWYGQPAASRQGRYMQTIAYTDAFLGRLCEELAARRLEENTILCVMGDHGVSFRTQDRFGRWVPYEEVIRVPWVVRWPGHLEPGRRIDWPCAQLDLTPTLLSLIGFDISQAGFEGRDALRPVEANRRLYFSSWYTDSPVGYLEGDRKWIYWPYNDLLQEYNLAIDPNERLPQQVAGERKARIIDELLQWQQSSLVNIHPRRFRERLLFDHWRAFSSGRSAWAYYVP